MRVDFAWPLLGAVDGRTVEDGLLETVVAFDVLEVAVFEGLGVSFEVRGVSFEVRGVSLVVAFGVVGVLGAFNLLLLDREVTAGTLELCRGNFFGVPNTSSSTIISVRCDRHKYCITVCSLVEVGRMLPVDFANLSVAAGFIAFPSTSTRPLLAESRDDTG